MKKLVTLSAIALAGATLGVGTTFGWWADETAEDGDKAKPKIAEKQPQDTPPGELNDILITPTGAINVPLPQPAFEANDISVKFSDSGAVETKPAEAKSDPKIVRYRPYQYVQAKLAPPAFEKLADQLEQEAKELDGLGRKEEAQVQRKVAQRLRETLKTQQQNVAAREATLELTVAGEGKEKHNFDVQVFKSEGAEQDADLKAQISKLKAELKRLEALVGGRPKDREPAMRNITIHRKEPITKNGVTVNQDVYDIKATPAPPPKITAPFQAKVARIRQEPYTIYRNVVEWETVPVSKQIVAEADQKVDKQVAELKQRIAEREEIAAKADDPKAAHQRDAELQALQAQLKEILVAQEAVRAKWAKVRGEDVKARVVKVEEAEGQQAKPSAPEVGRDLREIAEQLQKSGHPEAAHAIRKQAERLNLGAIKGQLTITLGNDGKLDKSELEVHARKGGKDQVPEIEIVRRTQQAEQAARALAEQHAHAHAAPHMAKHFGEMHEMLHDLRNEIAELRQEVKGLRGLLKSDRQAGKQDREEEDEDAKSGSKRKLQGEDVRKVKIKPSDDEAKPGFKDGGSNKSKSKPRDDDKEDKEQDDDDGDRDEDAGDKSEKESEDRKAEGDDAQSSTANSAFQFFLGLQR